MLDFGTQSHNFRFNPVYFLPKCEKNIVPIMDDPFFKFSITLQRLQFRNLVKSFFSLGFQVAASYLFTVEKNLS